MSPLESGKLFDEFLLNNNGVLLQLFDDNGNAIELPSQGAKNFPRFLDGGIATENTDPAAYRATHSYLFSFAGSDTVYTLTVAGSAHEVDLLRNTLANVFIILFFVILIIATLASMIYSRYVTRPVLRLSAVSKNMSELNFSWKCEESRTDELGVLAHSLNEMSKKLSAALENLQAANIKLQADIEHEKELEQAQLDFFSAVSHELKTPMTSIAGFIDGILDGTIPKEKQNYYLGLVSTEVRRLSRLVVAMLNMSKIESGEFQMKPNNYDISDQIIRILLTFEQKIEKKNIEIIGLEDLQPQYIVADPDMIYQVIYNLFDNAVKFTNEDGFIKVTLEDLGSQIRVSIKNSGAGIKAEELSRVFERFYKVDKSRSLDAKGAGLGLYIVKMMVEMHSGRIYAKSEDENTAEFVFTLPKAFTPVNKKGAKEA